MTNSPLVANKLPRSAEVVFDMGQMVTGSAVTGPGSRPRLVLQRDFG